MPSKLIAIKEELYNELSRLKKGNESFSDVIENLLQLQTTKNPLAHFGIGQEFNEKDLDDFEMILIEKRKEQRKLKHDRLNKEM